MSISTINISEQKKNKQYALDHAGEILDFIDNGIVRSGKIVGYYYEFALLVMELDERPSNPIDPIMGSLSHNGIPLTKGSYYTFCEISDITKEKQENKEINYPHKCIKCGNPAFILFRTTECSFYECDNYKSNRG